MRILFCLFLLVGTSILINAQGVPYAVNYQAIARDAEGVPIPNASVRATLNILKGSQTGAVVFSEQHATETNDFGLYLLIIGEGSGSDELSNIDWEEDDYFIETEIQIDGGSAIESVSKLNSVPYSFLSYRSVIDEVRDGDYDAGNEIQFLDLVGTTLYLTQGNQVELSGLLTQGSSDDQQISDFSLNGNMLNLSLEDGGSQSVDLSGFSGFSGNETLTALSLDGMTLVYSDEYGVENVIDLESVMADVQQLVDGNPIARYNTSYGGTIDIEETITSLVDNGDGTLTYTAEDGMETVITKASSGTNTGTETLTRISFNPNTNSINYKDENGDETLIDLCTSVDNCETVTSLSFNPITSELIYVDEDNATNNIPIGDVLSVMLDLNTFQGKVIATHISGDGTVTDINETITTFVDNGDGTYTYTSEDGTETVLSAKSDDDPIVKSVVGSDNDGTKIKYAAVQGPEAAVYDRGHAKLNNGECFIPFSKHFKKIVNHESATVVLTPHSIDTYGLAVVEKRADGFVVKELRHGKSNFSFDWEVKAVRKNYEDFKVRSK